MICLQRGASALGSNVYGKECKTTGNRERDGGHALEMSLGPPMQTPRQLAAHAEFSLVGRTCERFRLWIEHRLRYCNECVVFAMLDKLDRMTRLCACIVCTNAAQRASSKPLRDDSSLSTEEEAALATQSGIAKGRAAGHVEGSDPNARVQMGSDCHQVCWVRVENV